MSNTQTSGELANKHHIEKYFIRNKPTSFTKILWILALILPGHAYYTEDKNEVIK